MEIRGVQGNLGPSQVEAASNQLVTAPASGGQPLDGDKVQISPIARYLDQYNNLPQVRTDKVAAARQSIAAGTMDTDAKLSVSIDRMLDDLLGTAKH